MSAAQVKTQLHEYIDKADEKLLRLMHVMMQNYFHEEEAIVAFSAAGVPLTQKMMKEMTDEAVKSVENGDGLTSDEIRNLKKNW